MSRRLSVYLKQHSQVALVFLLGLLLVFGGIVAGFLQWKNTSTALVSIGCSLIAAAVVTYLSPVSEEVYQKFLTLGISDVYPSRREIANTQWVVWLRQARQYCALLGIANNNWCRDAEFPDAVADRLRHGVEVRLFFLDPTSQPAETRAREDNVRDTRRTIRDSIRFVWELRSKLEDPLKVRMKVYVYTATPSCGVLWIDSFMVVTHYLSGSANVTSPSIMVRPVGVTDGRPDLYGVYVENVQHIEREYATELTDNNVHNYT